MEFGEGFCWGKVAIKRKVDRRSSSQNGACMCRESLSCVDLSGAVRTIQEPVVGTVVCGPVGGCRTIRGPGDVWVLRKLSLL